MSSLKEHMIKLLEGDTGDITITSRDGSQIRAIRSIMANVSLYFADTAHAETTTFTVDLEHAGVEYILRYVYTLEFEPPAAEMFTRDVFRIMAAARVWRLDGLIVSLGEYLLTRETSAPEAIITAYEFGFEELERQASTKFAELIIGNIKLAYKCYDIKSSNRHCCLHEHAYQKSPSYCAYYLGKTEEWPENVETKHCCLHGGKYKNIDKTDVSRLKKKHLIHIIKNFMV